MNDRSALLTIVLASDGTIHEVEGTAFRVTRMDGMSVGQFMSLLKPFGINMRRENSTGVEASVAMRASLAAGETEKEN